MKSSLLSVRPYSVKRAQAIVAAWHRHMPRVQGGLFACGVIDRRGHIHGVGIAARPVARQIDDGLTMEIKRVATDGTPNVCSMIYGALCRAAKEIGFREAITYTLMSEPGSSLLASGFERVCTTDGGEHSRPSRPRRPAQHNGPKVKWRRLLSPEAKS